MKANFERSQYSKTGILPGTRFRLKIKIDLDKEEQDLVSKYKFRDAMVIDSGQRGLFLRCIAIGLIVTLGAMIILPFVLGGFVKNFIPALLIGAAGAFVAYQYLRKTIYLRDLIVGRTFKCRTVVDLVETEAWIENVLAYIRQALETSKHWDGVETKDVKALPPEEAKKAVLPKMRVFAIDI